MADLDPSLLYKLRVVDLREHLSSRGLPTSGLKADLVKRLKEALQNEKEDGSVSNIDDQYVADLETGSGEQESDEEVKVKLEKVDENEMHEAEKERLKVLKLEEDNKIEQQRLATERLIIERAEAEKLRIEQAEAERLRIEKAEAERLRIEQAEAERIRKEQAETERLRKEQAEAERIRKEQAETERLRRENAEAERLKREQAEAEKLRKEQAEAERLRKEQFERLRKEAEAERLRKEQAEAERLRNEHAEAERLRMEEEKAKVLKQQLEEKRKEERRKIEERRKLELEMIKVEEEKRKEERKRIENERRMETERIKIEAIKKEDIKREEEEEKRKAALREEKRVAAEVERRKAIDEEMKKEQEMWLVQEQIKKAQEEHKRRVLAEEQKRVLEEQQKIMEKEMEMQQSEHKGNQLQSNAVVFGPAPIRPPPGPPPMIHSSNIPVSASPIFPPPPFPTNLAETAGLLSFLPDENSDAAINMNESESMDTNENITDIRLPQALEKVLALKTERAQELGVDPDDVVEPVPVPEEKIQKTTKSSMVTLVSVDEDEMANEEGKNKKDSKSRRRKKKKKKHHNRMDLANEKNKQSANVQSKETSVDIDIEYVQEVIDISDPLYSQFMKIFEKFKLTDVEKEKEEAAANAEKEANKETLNPMALRKKPADLDDDDEDDEDDIKKDEKPKLSKRKLKKLSRMTVAELKQKVHRPELVEMHDVTAKDPVLLLHLKASRNTVPVPRHWCFKRKYLQGKRGIEKPAFELPDFIKRTGIMEMRQALQEKEDQKTMKAKMRERVRPKLGKIDIDYQKLHDAFFKWQTKPKMTIHGDLYYEGKEFETRLKEKKPGDLSEDLRTALGMPTGPNANKCPPPWLIAMQRYGPPPSYPNLKIPGLNAPIPDSCSFGYHAGGWGKPPVDETGRPLYGDVFGTQVLDNQPNIHDEEIDHTLWGELESESSEEEEEDEDEDEEEEEEEKQEDESGLVTPAEGLITPSGFSSIPAGMETPDMIELRKRKIEAEKEGGETPALYTILPEKKTERVGAAMMGSTHIYDLAAAIPASKLKMAGTTSVPPHGIELALDPSELEMDSAAMAARYEQTMREQQSQLEKEDLSDMVAEHAARQKNKRKKQQLDSAKPPKKYKEFKF